MNNRMFVVTVMLASVVVASAGFGAEPAIKPSSVLEVIPAGSSYYAVHDIAKTVGDVEKFLNDIGVGTMLGIARMQPGDGRQRPSILLEMLKTQLKLGKGFNAAGGAAVVMLDPSSVGRDLLKDFEAAGKKAEQGVSYFKTLKIEELVVAVLPGKVEGFFAGVEVTADGEFSVINLQGQKLFASQKGQYVVISPAGKAVLAVLNAKKSAIADLSKDELDLAGRSNVTARFNAAPYRPLLARILDEADKALKKNFDPITAAGFGVYVSFARGLVAQFDSMTIGVGLGADGINIDSISATRAGSAAAEIMQAESGKSGGAKVLDSLPSMPYVIAVGVRGWLDNKVLSEVMLDMSQRLINDKAIFNVDEKTKAKMKAHNVKMARMVTATQVVIGGAPLGKGMVTMGYVIRCKDAAEYRKALPENLAFNKPVLKAGNPLAGMDYVKNAETIDGLSIDAIDIRLAGGMFGPEVMAKGVKMILGEKNLRMRIATPDAKTLVLTLGGSKAFLRKALQAASGAGPIPKMPGTVAAMKHLPKDCTIVSLFNVTNLLDVIRTGMLAAEAPPDALAIIPTLKCQAPVAFGAKAKGTAMHTGLFISKTLVKEGVEGVKASIASFEETARQRRREMERVMEEMDDNPPPGGGGDF